MKEHEDKVRVTTEAQGTDWSDVGQFRLGPRTFVRVDKGDELIAYVGGPNVAEAVRRARLFAQALADEGVVYES